jgi:hypothetical protein
MRLNLANSFLLISILLAGLELSNCWESYELDLFDLVEEIGENFYNVFGLPKVSN